MFSYLLDVLYTITVLFVRFVKKLEFFVLAPFSILVEQIIRDFYEEVGVVIHKTDLSYKTWTKEDNDKILKKCSPFDRVIHIKVNSKYYFVKLANDPLLGFGRGFMNKEWELLGPLGDLHLLVYRCLKHPTIIKLAYNPWFNFLNYLEFGLFNTQKRRNMLTQVNTHYDLGNELFTTFLDPWMQYSNGYWDRGDINLEEAQFQKLELIAKKLKLKPGMRVLEIGCGWGMLCKFLAEKHGVHCVGLTVSKEQVTYGMKACEGLPVELRLQDYRDVDEKFDRVVSIEMIEHTGHHNHHEFFKTAHRCLKNNGLLLVQVSTMSESKKTPARNERWVHDYVLPHANIPYLWEMSSI